MSAMGHHSFLAGTEWLVPQAELDLGTAWPHGAGKKGSYGDCKDMSQMSKWSD